MNEPNREDELLLLVEDVRYRLGEIDAYANAAEEMFKQIPWTIDRRYRRDLNRLSHLLGDAAEAASAAIDATEMSLSAVIKRRQAPRLLSGDRVT